MILTGTPAHYWHVTTLSELMLIKTGAILINMTTRISDFTTWKIRRLSIIKYKLQHFIVSSEFVPFSPVVICYFWVWIKACTNVGYSLAQMSFGFKFTKLIYFCYSVILWYFNTQLFLCFHLVQFFSHHFSMYFL